MSNIITKIQATGGEITLSHEIVNKYLVSGKGKCSEQETMMFIALCKYRGLNPFLREAYLIKYSDSSPASMVVGKEAFAKRAAKNPKYRGHTTGISEDGKVAWAEVYMEGYTVPVRCEVDYDEYVGTKDEWVNGQNTGRKIVNSMWASKPKTMLKKVALCQAWREAMPEDFGGMYGAEEINTVNAETLPNNVVDVNLETGEITPPAKTQMEEAGERFGADPKTEPAKEETVILGIEKITKKKVGLESVFHLYSGDKVFTTAVEAFASFARTAKENGLKVEVKHYNNRIETLEVLEMEDTGEHDNAGDRQ